MALQPEIMGPARPNGVCHRSQDLGSQATLV